MNKKTRKKRIAWNKGIKMKPRTIEHSLNLSKSLKGLRKSDIAKENISNAKKGKKFSDIHKLNLSKAKLGFKHSEETKKKMSSIKIGKYTGSDSPNWKGGITPINKKIRYSTDYKLWRWSVKERDKNKCIWCGSTDKLEVDHIKPFALYPELRFAIDNGRTLCRNCHKTTNTYGGRKIYKINN